MAGIPSPLLAFGSNKCELSPSPPAPPGEAGHCRAAGKQNQTPVRQIFQLHVRHVICLQRPSHATSSCCTGAGWQEIRGGELSVAAFQSTGARPQPFPCSSARTWHFRLRLPFTGSRGDRAGRRRLRGAPRTARRERGCRACSPGFASSKRLFGCSLRGCTSGQNVCGCGVGELPSKQGAWGTPRGVLQVGWAPHLQTPPRLPPHPHPRGLAWASHPRSRTDSIPKCQAFRLLTGLFMPCQDHFGGFGGC